MRVLCSTDDLSMESAAAMVLTGPKRYSRRPPTSATASMMPATP